MKVDIQTIFIYTHTEDKHDVSNKNNDIISYMAYKFLRSRHKKWDPLSVLETLIFQRSINFQVDDNIKIMGST